MNMELVDNEYNRYINEQNRKALILLAGCVCKGYWEQQEILEELNVTYIEDTSSHEAGGLLPS